MAEQGEDGRTIDGAFEVVRESSRELVDESRQLLAAAAEAERAQRARFSAVSIKRVRSRLLAAVRKPGRTSEKFKTITTLETCEDWKLVALHEFMHTLVPDGDAATAHVTAIRHMEGSRLRRSQRAARALADPESETGR